MVVSDRSAAENVLHNVSYYRLSAYMLPFKERDTTGCVVDRFAPDTDFATVYGLYLFDAELRLLTFSAIERIEVSLRSQIIYQLSHKYGSHWTDNAAIFRPSVTRTNRHGQKYIIGIYETLRDHIAETMLNAEAEEYLRHYKNTYVAPANPPAWMSVETMYFNQLSLICKNLAHDYDRFPLANYYRLPIGIFNSWLHSLNNVRNICAHHGRLWNRDINIVPDKLPSSVSQPWVADPTRVPRKKFYYTMCILQYILHVADPTFCIKQKFENLLAKYPFVNLEYMGFPADWKSEPIWK